MKKGILLILVCLLSIFPTDVKSELSVERSLFISMIQDPFPLSDAREITELVEFAEQKQIKTLFVQIYRAGKSYFPFEAADSALYHQAFKNVGEDPFRLLIQKAHQKGIEVHAWLNLLSLSANENAPLLQKYGPDVLTKNLQDKRTIQDYKIDNQYFLEPGDPRVREELVKIVGEIVQTYPALDGIQFDYIRYPDQNPHYGFTKVNVERFKKATGIQVIEEKSETWQNWKRTQVTELLTELIQKARSIRPGIQVSTTGCMSYIRAYHEAFQDWPHWIESGLIDFVTIMSYKREPEAFRKQIEDARLRVTDFRKVNIGIGAYELLNVPQDFARQTELCHAAGGRGCAFFHYENLIENPALGQAVVKIR